MKIHIRQDIDMDMNIISELDTNMNIGHLYGYTNYAKYSLSIFEVDIFQKQITFINTTKSHTSSINFFLFQSLIYSSNG